MSSKHKMYCIMQGLTTCWILDQFGLNISDIGWWVGCIGINFILMWIYENLK